MEFVHPEDKDLTLGKIKVMQSQNIVVHFINRLVQKDGAIRNIDWHAKLVGSMIYATARDITIRVQAETALEEQTRQFELAVSGSNDGIFDWDLITNEVYFSPKWKEQLGFLDNELPNNATYRWIRARGAALRNASGQAVRMAG
jgi:PAS domain-containing protein